MLKSLKIDESIIEGFVGMETSTRTNIYYDLKFLNGHDLPASFIQKKTQ